MQPFGAGLFITKRRLFVPRRANIVLMVRRFLALLGLAAGVGVAAEGDADAKLAALRTAALKAHKETVAPFFTKYCMQCHGEKKKKGGVTFQYAVKAPGTASFQRLWKQAAADIKTANMPPEDQVQPTEQERKAVLDWIAGMKHLSKKDPGPFVIRRLSKTEYGNTLHDLFGVEPGIVSELPAEVSGAGYTNSVSPLLMEQVLNIANDVLKRLPPGGELEKTIVGPPPAAGQDAKAVARGAARSFARKAYRRPPTEAELDVLMKVFALATEKGSPTPKRCGWW